MGLKPIVLIGCSRHFLSARLFEAKISKILCNLDDFEVVAVGDKEGIISQKFRDRVINTISYEVKASVIDKILKQSDYVVMFWDGTDVNKFVYRSLLNKKKIRVIPVETTKVVNKDRGDPFDVYIGRGTLWGNPFVIGDDGIDRDEAIRKFQEYFKDKFLGDENKRKELLSLRGKTLGCHCKPYPCHGDVIARYLNTLEDFNEDASEAQSFDKAAPEVVVLNLVGNK